MRGRLIQWLLRSTAPCRVGLHTAARVVWDAHDGVAWDDVRDLPDTAGWYCAACGKEL